MSDVRVIVSGCGGVGSNLVRLLASKKGIRLVGVLDIVPEKVGKDVGTVVGIEPLGVTITSDATALYRQGADVVICTASPSSERATFELMKSALLNGINVIVANMGTCNLWHTDPDLAAEINEVCEAHGVSYFGIGATQMQDRFILLNTEGCSRVDKITFTHFADIHAFRPESFRVEWGVTLTEDEFYEGLENGTIEKHDYFANGITYIANHLGWIIDHVTSKQEPMVGEDRIVYGTHFTFVGYEGERVRIETNWLFLLDEERRYYDRVTIEGTPYIDSMNSFSPDRGMVSTFAALTNAIPFAVKSAPGYINTLELPALTLFDDDINLHL